jgi:hypothetical protein
MLAATHRPDCLWVAAGVLHRSVDLTGFASPTAMLVFGLLGRIVWGGS